MPIENKIHMGGMKGTFRWRCLVQTIKCLVCHKNNRLISTGDISEVSLIVDAVGALFTYSHPHHSSTSA